MRLCLRVVYACDHHDSQYAATGCTHQRAVVMFISSSVPKPKDGSRYALQSG